MMTRYLAAFLLVLIVCLPGRADTEPPRTLEQAIEEIRAAHGLVALGVAVADAEGDILALAVTGVRIKGRDDPVQPGDAWHIGSNTKMLTALLYGRLVERGEAKWGATLPELFPDLAAGMDPAWQDVTIEHLLSHRSGLAANPSSAWFVSSRFSKASPAAQRTSLAESFLSKPPSGVTGEFEYSNLGYMIAGAAIDRIADRLGKADYETLFLSTLVPEGEGWGFGPPQEGVEGHSRGLFGGLSAKGRGAGADNPAALAPAGTLHVPLAAHARFLSQFLEPDPTQEKLLTPFPNADSGYALGWGVGELDPHGRVWTHNGSNTMWFSMVMLVPQDGLVIVVDTSQFDEDAREAAREMVQEVLTRYAPVPAE